MISNSNGRRSILLIQGQSSLPALGNEPEELAYFSVEAVADFRAGFSKLNQDKFVGVVLDLVQPGSDGFELLMCLRRNYPLPIIAFSQTTCEADRILAYEMGADDVLSSAVSKRELVARVQAVLSRAMVAAAGTGSRFEVRFAQDLQIDLRSRKVLKGANPLSLTSLEFDLLAILIQRVGRVSTRESLLNALSDGDYSVLERTVDVHIASLRRKLGDDSKKPKYIRTVRGIGYQLLDMAPRRGEGPGPG